MKTAPNPTDEAFQDACKQVLQSLRGALTEALATIQVDPSRPQAMARTIGLHRNLAWKVSKIVTGHDVFGSVPHVPGRAGFQILVRALGKAGVPVANLKRLEQAFEPFDRLIAVHTGDRATLDLVAGHFVPEDRQRESLGAARKLAFRGNSAIWGARARVRLAAHILKPNAADPTRVDVAQVGGLIDFRRLHRDVHWLLFPRAAWSEQPTGSVVHGIEGAPIDPAVGPDAAPLMRDFCSPNLPDLVVVREPRAVQYELPGGPVGRTADITCIYGVVVRSVGSQFADGTDDRCELACAVTTPAEVLQFDVLVHRALTWAMHPRVDVFSRLDGRPMHPPVVRERCRLRIDDRIHELGWGVQAMPTPHVPRYGEMLAYSFDKLGWNPDEFHGFRYEIPYPAIPTVTIVSAPLLPVRP